MKYFIPFLSLLPFTILGQQFVPASRLVQLVPGADASALLTPENVQSKQISAQLNVWELKFNTETDAVHWDEQSLPNEVIHAQKNHLLKKRGAPNDPEYSIQWQHHVTPANSPVSGSSLNGDVGSEEAWELTVGGKLPGTTHDLVVCILDDGVKKDHEDLLQNLWVNTSEIPNNGIDDDGNGYVDDFRGWNIYTLSDEIQNGTNAFGVHGTKVAGMAGARGGNSTGVTGVNQRVKLMIVVAEGSESDAIGGYDYPLTQRKLFNETLGAEGALVVSTNASWGVDFGKPADAPIWCSLYDSLGSAGIISTAATANNNTDVDQDGDLPTACPSQYLIGVTNNNALGEKVVFAGYGQEHIDLSAPGEEVHTTTLNGYGSASGTSFSAPMVAGAIALCYSYACGDLVDLMINEPQTVAAYMRQAVLDGVKLQSTQAGLTATNGSLYLPGALEQVDFICSTLTSVSEVGEGLDQVRLYPNPVDEVFSISTSEIGEYRIFNVQGNEVLTGKTLPGEQLPIRVEQLPAGIYLFELATANGLQSSKFIKR